MKLDSETQVVAVGVVGPFTVDDILFTAAKSNRIAPLQVVGAKRVVGFDHIRSAALHAQRAEREGRMQAKSVEVEFVRYLAGERQIRTALLKVGVTEDTDRAVVVGLGPKAKDAVQHFLHALGLREDDSVMDATPQKLASFGITQLAIDVTTPGREYDLVFEAVALVDLMK